MWSVVSWISSFEATWLLFVGDNEGRVYVNKEKLPMNFMCWEIFPECGRPGQMLEVGISRLFYETGQAELQGQVEGGFIYENSPVTAAMLLKNIKYTLWNTIVKELTTHKEIEQIISSLKSKNSHGYDDVSVNILKSSSPYISSPLCHICNKMLSTGIFPDRLKHAEVKPIFKNGDKSDVSNYRPISLLPAFSKVLEKVIYVRMYQYLVNNSILINEQFGFRPQDINHGSSL